MGRARGRGRALATAVAPAALLALALALAAPANAAPPANDARADARPVTVPSTVTGTTRDATLQPNDPGSFCSGGPESTVWYSLDPATSERVTVELRARGDLEPVVEVFRRDRSRLDGLDCDTGDRRGRASVAFTAERGERYLIRVGQEPGSEPGDFALELFAPEPEATPPGRRLPRRGGTATVDRARDLSDAWSRRLVAGRPYVVALASRSAGCPSATVFAPGIGSFAGAEPLDGTRCNRHDLFTPDRTGRYSFLVRAGRAAPGPQRYRLRVRRATRDDTAPGRTIGNYQRVAGRVGAGRADVVDLLRLHVHRRSDVELRFDGPGLLLELRTVRGARVAISRDAGLRARLHRGRYYAVVRATREGGGRYTLQPVIRQITRTHVAINGRHDSVIAPGRAATVGVRVTPPASGRITIVVERLDPLDGWQFHRRFARRTATGVASATFVPSEPGRFRARAVYAGSRLSAPSETGWAYVSARETF